MSTTLPKVNVVIANCINLDSFLDDPSVGSMCFLDDLSLPHYIGGGFTLVGNADITFNPLPRAAIVGERISNLKTQRAAVYAKAEADVQNINAAIAQLLAIDNAPTIVNALSTGSNGIADADFKDIPF